MIYRLQRKFILISTVSIFTVVFIVFAAIALINVTSVNNTLDILAATAWVCPWPSPSWKSIKAVSQPTKKTIPISDSK